MTKKFDHDGNSFMVSRDVEIDTDGLVEENKSKTEKTLKEINENIKKITEDTQIFSKSSCLVYLKKDNNTEFSGTLESYKKYYGTSRHPEFEFGSVKIIEIVFWVGYDSFVKLQKCLTVQECLMEHIKGTKIVLFKETVSVIEFNILEIDGPLFKMQIKFGKLT